jgi:hypothetical protein
LFGSSPPRFNSPMISVTGNTVKSFSARNLRCALKASGESDVEAGVEVDTW